MTFFGDIFWPKIYTHVGDIFHYPERPTTSQIFMFFARFRPRLGVVTASITFPPPVFLFVGPPASFFVRWSRFFSIYIRTSSVGTCSRYRKYVHEQINTCIVSCTYRRRYVQQIKQFCGVGVYLQHQLKQRVRWVRTCISRNSSMCSALVGAYVHQQVHEYQVGAVVRTAVGTYLQQLYIFSSIYLRASTVGNMQYVHQQVQYVRAECRCNRYLHILQQYFFFNIQDIPSEGGT